jgi:hypothetical protein
MAIYVPSFWDYLGQGIDRGVQGFEQGRQRTRQNVSDLMQQLEFTQKHGTVEDTQRVAEMLKLYDPKKYEGINVGETPEQARRRILKPGTVTPQSDPLYPGAIEAAKFLTPNLVLGMKPPEAPKISEPEYEFAGLTSPTQRAQAERARNLTEQKLQQDLTVGGQQIAAGADAAANRSRDRALQAWTALGPAADGLAADIIARQGGIHKVGEDVIKNVAREGLASLVKDMGMTYLTADDMKALEPLVLRSIAQAQDRYMELQIRRLAAQNSRMGLDPRVDDFRQSMVAMSQTLNNMISDLRHFELDSVESLTANALQTPEERAVREAALARIAMLRSVIGIPVDALAQGQTSLTPDQQKAVNRAMGLTPNDEPRGERNQPSNIDQMSETERAAAASREWAALSREEQTGTKGESNAIKIATKWNIKLDSGR